MNFSLTYSSKQPSLGGKLPDMLMRAAVKMDGIRQRSRRTSHVACGLPLGDSFGIATDKSFWPASC